MPPAATVQHDPLFASNAQDAGETPGTPADASLEREVDVGTRRVADGVGDGDGHAPRVGGIAVSQHDEQVDVAGRLQLAAGRRAEQDDLDRTAALEHLVERLVEAPPVRLAVAAVPRGAVADRCPGR